MAGTIRFGILGTGWIARKFADDLRYATGCTLAAVASRDAAKAKAFAEACAQKPVSFGSYEELAAFKDVDIIYIATPHNRHRDDALACLREGKHVLVEKPFALNRGQAEEIGAEARKRGLFAMEALWTRFLPAARGLMERIRGGAIGDVPMVVADLSFKRDFDPKSRLFDPGLAGGSLLDVGIYPITFAIMAAGRLPSAWKGYARLCSTGVDDAAAISLSFSGGTLASLSCGFAGEGHKDGIVYGSKATARLLSFWMTKGWEISEGGKTVASFRDPSPGMGYQFEAMHAAECISMGVLDSPVMPMAESCAVMGIMDDLRKDWGVKYPGE
jgi:dihydrodiol dehydrogenase / D-xylose 1-dehydrogenase (NADP)